MSLPVHSSLIVIIIILGNVAFAAIGAIIIRRGFDTKKLGAHHKVGGYFFGVVGVLYALVLGLFIGNVHDKFDQAVASAQAEANACSDIWNFSRGFPRDVRARICNSVREFYVVEQTESWEKIAAGKEKEASIGLYNKLWQDLLEYQPSTERENACYQSCLGSLQDLSDARSMRFSSSNFQQAPFVWAVMLIGAVMIIVFTYFFFIEKGYVQIALTSLVAAFLGLNLLIVDTFQHPYRRNLNVQREAFSFKPEVFQLENTLRSDNVQQEK